MSIKKTLFLITATLFAAIPFQAQAGDLIANNRTNFDSTTVTNGAVCSTILGETGISRAHTEGNVIPDRKVRLACGLRKHDCVAAVKMTANCTGRTIATVVFDVDKGIVSITPAAGETQFKVSGSGFVSTVEQIS